MLTNWCGGTPCYGGEEGIDPLPDKLDDICDDCIFKSRYCADEQRSFPDCPEGYAGFYRYVDRYGWGGIDYTKYTICRELG
jgi:hypothetical protein